MGFLPERRQYSAPRENVVIFAELVKLQKSYEPQIVFILSNFSAKYP